jgi:hypothetical protein
MKSEQAPPWYRNFWPWFIIAILSWGVISSSITLTVALNNPPHMMTGDYAELGKALVDTHRRADRAEALGLSGLLTRTGAQWALSLDANEAGALGERLLLLAQHPTDSTRDRQVVLDRIAPGEYRAEAATIPLRGRIIVSDLEQNWWISSSYESDPDSLDVALAPERL